jgi:uncharacterized DUF497 family protein
VADVVVFDWDEANAAHIARHKVTSDEVEQMVANDPMDLEAQVTDGQERYTGVGHTNRLRVLVLVWTMRGRAIRPITALTQATDWPSVTGWKEGSDLWRKKPDG